MRIEISGAQVTDAVVDVLETLQTEKEIVKIYTEVIDALTRLVILDISAEEYEDTETMRRLRALQMIRRDIITLSSPPDADLPENDIPKFSV